MKRTRSYVTDYDDHVPDKTIFAHEDERSAIVKYPKANGGYFRLKFVQRPNPIGFTANLPGTRR